MTDTVLTAIDGGVLTITLNRPAKKNALTGAMYERFAGALVAAENDPAVRAVLIEGVSGAFCAGNDLEDFLAGGEIREARPSHLLINALARTTLPLVAAVDGVAIGIGTTMLLHCDFVYASSQARFALSFVNIGVCAEAGSSLLLPRLAGYQKAAELLLLGETFDAAAAVGFGLVGAVLEGDALREQARATAAKLAAKPRAAVRTTKALLRRREEPLEDRIRQEIVDFTELLRGPAAQEIMGAFLEKRAPDRSRYD